MYIVTGITQHTGRYFLQQLINNKYEGKIRCAVRKNSNIEILKNSGIDIEIVNGDLNDESFINEIMKEVETVLHIYIILIIL
ncbi:MAG: NAD-dependent epimerase/dehydratase family protein [Candidatus Methanofastidiosum sp.]|nr:NAD-dependent epimerase/dehydratase family protein [Methanofastidiosum sp.]